MCGRGWNQQWTASLERAEPYDGAQKLVALKGGHEANPKRSFEICIPNPLFRMPDCRFVFCRLEAVGRVPGEGPCCLAGPDPPTEVDRSACMEGARLQPANAPGMC